MKEISILYPKGYEINYKQMSDTACHDLALDVLCQKLSNKETEQKMIMKVISNMSDNPHVAEFRSQVFDDILNNPKMRNGMMKLLDKVQFLKDFGSFKKDYDKKASIWDLLHRLEEINDYIICVEEIRNCLSDETIESEGLRNLKAYVDELYSDSHFAEMKKDIETLKADTSNIRSITLGINVNERFETSGIGIISVNNKPFKNSGIVSNFAEALTTKSGVKDGNEWNGDLHFHPVEANDSIMDKVDTFGGFMATAKMPFLDMKSAETIVTLPDKDSGSDFTHYMDKVADQILSTTVKKLREVLSSYVTVSITTMTDLIPEFVYYIRFAEFIEKMTKSGYSFSKAKVNTSDSKYMKALGLYNIKLLFSDTKAADIVKNDLMYDDNHLLYILTGANRGGKTTITQAVGQLFVLAQGGIYIPGDYFEYGPVDCIYTHFPADEDKTLDLGRLGEECTRFKEMYGAGSSSSLFLLNETFSTTSFEEGYYIAKDSLKAILRRGIRTLYNTHMHKLAFDINEINEVSNQYKAESLIVKVQDGVRSFKIEVAPPEGMSYARDIAEKYGVTYEMLTGK